MRVKKDFYHFRKDEHFENHPDFSSNVSAGIHVAEAGVVHMPLDKVQLFLFNVYKLVERQRKGILACCSSLCSPGRGHSWAVCMILLYCCFLRTFGMIFHETNTLSWWLLPCWQVLSPLSARAGEQMGTGRQETVRVPSCDKSQTLKRRLQLRGVLVDSCSK